MTQTFTTTFAAAPQLLQECAGLSLAEVLGMISSPMGEAIVHITPEGAERPIRAIITRKGYTGAPGQSGVATAAVTVFVARDAAEGCMVIDKGYTRFRVRPLPHLPARELVVTEVRSGPYHFNLEAEG